MELINWLLAEGQTSHLEPTEPVLLPPPLAATRAAAARRPPRTLRVAAVLNYFLSAFL